MRGTGSPAVGARVWEPRGIASTHLFAISPVAHLGSSLGFCSQHLQVLWFWASYSQRRGVYPGSQHPGRVAGPDRQEVGCFMQKHGVYPGHRLGRHWVLPHLTLMAGRQTWHPWPEQVLAGEAQTLREAGLGHCTAPGPRTGRGGSRERGRGSRMARGGGRFKYRLWLGGKSQCLDYGISRQFSWGIFPRRETSRRTRESRLPGGWVTT